MGDVKTLGVRRIEELYRDYHHQLFGFFVKKGLDKGTAEDMSHEVFLRLLRSGKEIDGDGYARNLVYRVAQNLLIDHYRKHNGTVRVRLWSDEETPNAFDGDQGYPGCKILDPEECYLSSEVSYDVRRAMSRLPRHYARALVMREYQGMSYREIASDLGLTEKAVESLLHRAKSQLRKELAAAREGGWWTALVACLGRLKGRLRSAGESLIHCFRWGGIAHVGGIAGAGNVVWNMVMVCLLVCAVIGSGFLGRVGHGKDEVGRVIETTSARVMNVEEERAIEPRARGEGGSGNVKIADLEGLPATSLSYLFEITRLPWRGMVAGGGETLRALVKGSGDLLRTVLVTAKDLWMCMLEISEQTLSSVGMPVEMLWCFLLPADTTWEELRVLEDRAAGTAMDIIYAVEGAALRTGSEAEASLEAVPMNLEAESLEPPLESLAKTTPVSTLTVPYETSEGAGGTSTENPAISSQQLNTVFGILSDSMECVVPSLFQAQW